MRISDWSSDVCSSDLFLDRIEAEGAHAVRVIGLADRFLGLDRVHETQGRARQRPRDEPHLGDRRSEEHTSELQSLMRISYAVFCLKKKNKQTNKKNTEQHSRYNNTHSLLTQHIKVH